MQAAQKKRKVEKPLQFLSPEETEAFFRVISDTRDKAVFRLIYHRGLRASEIAALQLSDWSDETERLMVRRKKGSISAPFRLTAVESRVLRAWVRIRGVAAGPLFGSRKHSALSRFQVFRLMQRYCRRANIPAERSHPHALKHTCATHLLEKLGDITLVQDWLGHKDLKSTAIYAKVVNPSREKATLQLRDWK
jgi:site-specific recombinase XerD